MAPAAAEQEVLTFAMVCVPSCRPGKKQINLGKTSARRVNPAEKLWIQGLEPRSPASQPDLAFVGTMNATPTASSRQIENLTEEHDIRASGKREVLKTAYEDCR